MSKMREALREAFMVGTQDSPPSFHGQEKLDEIAQRYGDLEFTREEVRGLVSEALAKGKRLHPDTLMGKQDWDSVIAHILSRHTEGEPEPAEEIRSVKAMFGKRYTREEFSIDDNTPTKEDYLNRADDILREKCADTYGPDGKREDKTGTDHEMKIIYNELANLQKQVSVLRKRALSRAHHKRCKWALAAHLYERGDVDEECTCGFHEVEMLEEEQKGRE